MARPLGRDRLIPRAPQIAAANRYDLAVVGGGVHGACLALEATRRGLRVVLLEAADFGSGASGNSLRILHGGLRYLQSADLIRFRESVAERRWFARTFPDLVEPLPCLMPLYADGLKRRSVMRIALAMNDWLSADRNDQLPDHVQLPAGGTFDVKETQRRFPGVRTGGLQGSALWYDYRMRSSERVLIEILHWACGLGAAALNYTRAIGIRGEAGRVRGVQVEDQLNGERYDIQADRVCNCTGSLARAFAAAHDREHAELFVPSLAFNVLFDGDRPSQDALAIAAPDPGAPVYFLCPAPFGIWAGTEHAGRPDRCLSPEVTEAELFDFIGRINRAIPSINLSPRRVRRVFSGLLPVRTVQRTDLTAREAIVDHGARGGLSGLYSVTGIKFTTARKVGVRAVDAIMGAARADVARPMPRDATREEHLLETPAVSPATGLLLDGARVLKMSLAEASAVIREVAAAESAVSAQDFCLRRTNWAFTAPDFTQLENLVTAALGASARTAARSMG
jgi:glycerol-3-phosphate dehydrogenase